MIFILSLHIKPTVSNIGAVVTEQCGKGELSKCFKTESQSNAATLLSLMPKPRLCSDMHAEMCSNLNDEENCVRNFIDRCIPPATRDIHLQKYVDKWNLDHEICHGYTKQLYILHSSCFLSVWRRDLKCKDIVDQLQTSLINLERLKIGKNYPRHAVEEYCW